MDTAVRDLLAFIAAHSSWAGPILFLACFGESLAVVSLFVPGTAILVTAGALVQSHALPLWPVLVGAMLGATLGDAVSYWVGRSCGHTIQGLWPFKGHPAALHRSLEFFERHGGKSVFIGRFFGPLRAFVPLGAGIMHMPARRFWIANVASAAVWAPGLLVPGVVMGLAAEAAATDELVVALAALVLLILGSFGFEFARRRFMAAGRTG
jgi:membrane protein DedA with SNARE-associated domain